MRLFVLLFVGLLAISAQAKNTSVVVLTTPLPVFSEVSSSGRVTGYAVELAEGVLAQANLQADVQPVPFARALVDAKENPSSLIAGLARIPKREDDYYWITPIAANPATLFVLKDSPLHQIKGATLEHIESVSVMRHDYREDAIRQYSHIGLVETSTWVQAIELVKKGRVQGVFYSPVGMSLSCGEANIDCDDLVPLLHTDVGYSYLAMRKSSANQALAEVLMNAASEYKISARFQGLVKRTLGALPLENVQMQEADGVLLFSHRPTKSDGRDLWVLTEHTPYFSERDEYGTLHGFAAEMVQDILAQARLDQSILMAPWERIYKEVTSKPNVLAFPVARTPERESLFHWITPVAASLQGVYARRGEHRQYSSLSAIPIDSVLAVIKGDYRADIAHQAGLNTQSYENWFEAFKGLVNNEVDLLFTSQGAIAVGCKQLAIDCVQIERVHTFKKVTTYLALSKQGTPPRLVEQLKLAAAKLKQTEQFGAFIQKWTQTLNEAPFGPVHIEHQVVKLWPEE